MMTPSRKTMCLITRPSGGAIIFHGGGLEVAVARWFDSVLGLGVTHRDNALAKQLGWTTGSGNS
jgi:hypothetical protein